MIFVDFSQEIVQKGCEKSALSHSSDSTNIPIGCERLMKLKIILFVVLVLL